MVRWERTPYQKETRGQQAPVSGSRGRGCPRAQQPEVPGYGANCAARSLDLAAEGRRRLRQGSSHPCCSVLPLPLALSKKAVEATALVECSQMPFNCANIVEESKGLQQGMCIAPLGLLRTQFRGHGVCSEPARVNLSSVGLPSPLIFSKAASLHSGTQQPPNPQFSILTGTHQIDFV